MWSRVTGTFYRAVDPEHRDLALSGSRFPGRYSTAEQPTLYLSSSPEGVAAAVIAHDSARAAELEIVTVEVDAERILDFRDSVACSEAAIDRDASAAPWQEVVKAGGEPSSWRVRRQLDGLGANGLIDPSRKAPGLWHLALFRWNHVGDPNVSLQGV